MRLLPQHWMLSEGQQVFLVTWCDVAQLGQVSQQQAAISNLM
jgi:hypothetical protein